MSFSEYPTIVATVVAITDRGKQSNIIQLLQQHYSMDPEDARQLIQKVPFKLPVSFFTLKEGQTAVRELVGLGCEITFRDLMDPEPEPEEEPAPEPEAEEPPVVEEITSVSPPEPPPQEALVDEGAESEKTEEEPEPSGWWKLWERRIIRLGSYFILISFLTIAYWFLALDRHWTAPKDGMPSEFRDFSKTALGKLVSQIDEQIKQMGSMDQFLKELPEKLEQEKVTRPQREELSNHYHEKASRPKAKRDNIQTMRAIQMLKVALVANSKNQKAWKLLVEKYQERGMFYKMKKTQRSMLKAIGRDAMVEIYGVAVVDKLQRK